MNNQYPYNAPEQSSMPSNQQPVMPAPQPGVPQGYPPQYPYAQVVRRKFFDRDMVSVLGCACSVIGLCLAITSAIVGGNATYIYGLIMIIVSLVFSSGGFMISLIIGNKNTREGKPRGNFASWGLILGLTGIILFIFLIFFSSCMTCYYNKRGGVQW